MPSSRRRRRTWWAAGLVVIVTAVGGIFAVSGGSPTTTRRGAAGGSAAPFQLEEVREGRPGVSLAGLAGTPVVLNFWASWCIPCAKEMPAFQSVAEETERRVAFVGINHQDSRRGARELLERTGVQYPAGYDPQGNVAQAYRVYGMPTTVFISPTGRVLERRTGEMTRAELRQAIRRLFLVPVA